MCHRPVLRLLATSALFLSAAACSGSDGGGSGAGFQLTRISLLEGAVWKVNQEIVFSFSDEVDFSSISANTISIRTQTGAPALGSYFLRGTSQVVFQPNCPTLANLSDTGLVAGSESYVIRVLGLSSGAGNTVRSSSGSALQVTQTRNFTTADVGDEFLDTVQGPPVPVVRDEGSSVEDATYLEVGGDPDNRVYFERDASQALVLSVPGFESPLNLYSDPAQRVAFVLVFNQALHPSDANISSTRMRLEFLNGLVWQPLETRVALVANCTETGARVRLEPIGVLPRGSSLRAVVLPGLQDLVLNQTSQANDSFAVVPIQDVDFSSLSPADTKSDEFDESFDFGGESTLSFEDSEALFSTPKASWADGRLRAAFEFDGAGGPGGSFDWVVENGDEIVVDTDNGIILGADGITTQLIQDGVIDVRNLRIDSGSEVRLQGSKPARINATGSVIIRGILDVSGFDAPDVQQLNSGNQREVGAAGGPGGGRGGSANDVVTNSTSEGGFGQGPAGTSNAGGQGGETGFSSSPSKDSRRPGGGAGGRFAGNQGAGLNASNGLDGHADATGAITGQKPPLGGLLGTGPFLDQPGDLPHGGPINDFFGTRALGTSGNVTELIRGELPRLWGGYGGGGGGNANPASVFPTPNWTPASDEKGGAGGGGGGALHIRALGPIQFGAAGQILCNGGRGGVGENILGQDHVGGNGGSGSGGHVVLETASFVDFTDGGAAPGTANRDWISARGGAQVQGAATSGGNVSFGGAGGPGVIQLHVPDSLLPPSISSLTSDIVVPTPAAGSGNPIDAVTSPAAIPLVPSFGVQSNARSQWISIGGADQTPSGIPSLLQFLFQGTDTSGGADDGKILVAGEEVQELAPLLDEDLEGNPNATVLADRVTLRLEDSDLTPFTGTTAGVSNDIYLRNPALLENFVLRLSSGAAEDDFTIASASYDEGGNLLGDESLELTVTDDGQDLQDFVDANTALGTVHYTLVPRFFRVVTGGLENSLPTGTYVRIRFQAAADNGLGQPDEISPLVDWTSDISQFNSLLAGEIQFFRFEVEFELNASGGAVSPDTQPVQLDFLRIPFVF